MYEDLEIDKKWYKLTQFASEKSHINFFSIPGIVGDEFLQNISNIFSLFSEDTFDEVNAPGKIFKDQGVRFHFPVLMVPGVISTSLELWEGQPCSRKFFRQRFWGTLSMLRIMLVDKYCWMSHMKLDPETGSDPSNIKLRAAQGIEAADFLLPGFWVWARVIENLALIGYDHNNMMMAPYDWRIDMNSLETRDNYFTRMKSMIEFLRNSHKRKVVILCHSLGSMVWLYFMKWVEADPSRTGGIGGNGGSSWVQDHIESFVNIGGPLLGVPKSISCIISGEMKDTAQMGQFETYILEAMFSKKERLDMFRTWPGPISMIPKGGDLLWETSFKESNRYGLVSFQEDADMFDLPKRIGFDGVEMLMSRFLPKAIGERVLKLNSIGVGTPKEIKENDNNPQKWSNPLEFSLPKAPGLKIYCFYGFKKQTELGYVYKKFQNENDVSESETERVSIVINRLHNDPSHQLFNGVVHSDGDGTVPLISLGFMCRHGWKDIEHLNPSNITVITKEFEHEPSVSLVDLRGGPKTGDHVDILGNHEVTSDIIKIVSNFQFLNGKEEMPQDRILSDIEKISEKVMKNINEFYSSKG